MRWDGGAWFRGNPKNWRNLGSLSRAPGRPPLRGTATVRSVSMVTTAGPARRTAAATNDWRDRAAAGEALWALTGAATSRG